MRVFRESEDDQEFVCIKTISHPNTGTLIRKGQVCKITNTDPFNDGKHITVSNGRNSINMYRDLFGVHFEAK